MAIAVSLLLLPSRRLRRWQAGLATSALIAALFAWPGDAPLAWLAMLAGLLCQPLLAARNGKGYRIDISDHGRIRLAVYLNPSPFAARPELPPLMAPRAAPPMTRPRQPPTAPLTAPSMPPPGPPPKQPPTEPSAEPQWQPAELRAGAVLWPWLLVLPLRLADGRLVRLLVLPDSVAPGAFRPLSVACRACAARDL